MSDPTQSGLRVLVCICGVMMDVTDMDPKTRAEAIEASMSPRATDDRKGRR